ncbi:MAG: DUF2254 domain-containing protein [Ilumatobacter sp.]|nr:DUF2254 domain-containing protein [Ilumatobacter sp.]
MVRLDAVTERIRSSLFFVPMAFVVASVVLALVSIVVDKRLVTNGTELPLGLTSTVDSARAVLSTVAGATITFAGIAFSVSLLLIQQASSQYSPRVVHGLFRDPFNKRIMGVVVGTFTFCLVVLRSVRGSLEEDGSPVIPNLSVGLAVVFGLISILSIVAFINHSAHSMDVSNILANVTAEAKDTVRSQWRSPDSESFDDDPVPDGPDDDDLVVVLDQDGWIQQVDLHALSLASDPGGTVLLSIAVGRYAISGTPLCSIRPVPHDRDESIRCARSSVVIGDTRTMQQDVGYGLRQLADVALKALSPGINDPTTAQDALFHLGSVLHEALEHRPPRRRQSMDDDRVLLLPEATTHRDLVNLAFDEVRLAARGLPRVCLYLLELISLIDESLGDVITDDAREALRSQARLIRDGADGADLSDHDRRRVTDAWEQRFG